MLFHAIRTTIPETDIYCAGLKPVSLMIDEDFADIITYPAIVSIIAPMNFTSGTQIEAVFINGELSTVDKLNQFFEDCKNNVVGIAIDNYTI